MTAEFAVPESQARNVSVTPRSSKPGTHFCPRQSRSANHVTATSHHSRQACTDPLMPPHVARRQRDLSRVGLKEGMRGKGILQNKRS